MGVAAAVIASAVIGAGSAAYQADEQKKAAEEDRKRRETAAAEAQAEADRIARETRPDEEALGEIGFGVDRGDEFVGGSTQEFLIPKTSALGGASYGLSGLGFAV